MMKRFRPLYNKKKIKKCVEDPKNWKNRPEDVTFIINSLDDIVKRAPDLKTRIKPGKIGVAGHSFGAYTTMAVAGAKVDLPGDTDHSFKNRRVIAFVAMSPQGTGAMGLDANSWSDINSPVLLLTGTEDKGMDGKDVKWRLESFQNMAGGDKYCAVIKDASHGTFSGRNADKKHLEYIKTATIAFWDAYLSGVEKAKEFIKSDSLKKINEAEADYKKK